MGSRWRWLTEQEDAALRRRYEAGETTKALAAALGCSEPAVRRGIVRAGGSLRSRAQVGALKHHLSDEAEKELCSLYLSGLDWRDLADRFCVKPKHVYDILGRHGVPRRSRSEQPRRREVNESAFDLPASPEALYWAGMLMADGSVEAPGGARSPTISLELQACDRGHVEAFAAFLGARHTVQVTKAGRAARLQVRSQRLADALAVFGVTPNKHGREEAPEWVTRSADFWRGYVDGDGGYYSTHVDQVYACGSKSIMDALRRFYVTRGLRFKAEVRAHASIFQLFVSGKAAVAATCILQAGDGPRMPRKRASAEAVMK